MNTQFDSQDGWGPDTDRADGPGEPPRSYSPQEITQLLAMVRQNYRVVRCPRHHRLMECLRLNRVDGRLVEIALRCDVCGFSEILRP